MGRFRELPRHHPTRRSLLAAAGATASTAGCIDRLRSVSSHTNTAGISFEIKTLPADEDPFAMLVARQLSEWFQSAGVDATVLPVTGDELFRQVLIARNFDAYVAQFPGAMTDPDGLYGLAHSSYAAEAGLQNPFGYSSLSADDALERQRTVEGRRRRDAVATLQETLLEENPFTVLAAPDRISAVNEERFRDLSRVDLRDPGAYFSLDGTDTDENTVQLVTTDFRPMTNLNPLSPENRQDGLLTGLLYDSLAEEDGTVPWLAADVSWQDGSDGLQALVTLRDGLTWHDGTALTAADIAFTYRFLADTTLGETEEPQPTTRYRGRSSLVETATIEGDRTVRLHFRDRIREVASRALSVPILPEHVWRDRSNLSGNGSGGTTAALVTDNVPPVGSGVFEFEEAVERERLVLSTFSDHFTTTDSPDVPAPFASGVAVDEMVVRFAGSDSSAVELVASGDVDATIANVGPDVVPRIGRHDDMDLGITSTGACYYAGYNVRQQPFSNTRFRGLLSHLIDRESLVGTVFDGYATPALTPLVGSTWVPEEFVWDGTDSVTPFFGENGTVDVERARAAFGEAGFQYGDDGQVLRD